MISADEMVSAMQTYHIGLEWGDDKRGVTGWQAKLVHNGKPFNKVPTATPQEAVEIARDALAESNRERDLANGGRLFEILSRGVIKYRTREVMKDFEGVQMPVKVWDIQKVSDSSVIVSGERSLRAAIIEAEKLGAV